MHKSARVYEGYLFHRIISGLLDLFILFVTAIALSYLLLYTVFSVFGYNDKKDRIKSIETEYGIVLSEGLEYTEYEKTIQNIYFNKYSNEIIKMYKDLYGDEYSIIHIYNIVILRLPEKPTFENYKTDYYQYTQNDDGSFAVDTLGVKVEGNGDYYERNLQSLFYNGYKKMSSLLEEFHSEYYSLITATYHQECYSRIISFLISFVVYFIIIPLRNKARTLFLNKYDLIFVNYKNGYYISKSKIVCRNIICLLLPFIGFIFMTKYSIIILTIGYILLDYLLLIFSDGNLNISDKLLRIETCCYSKSLIFENKEDEDAFLASEKGKEVLDADFLEKLSSAEELNVNTEDVEY